MQHDLSKEEVQLRNQGENLEQLEFALGDIKVITDVLEDEVETDFHEARCDIECELSDLISTNDRERKAFKRLLTQYHKADKYLDDALKAYIALHEAIKKEIAKNE